MKCCARCLQEKQDNEFHRRKDTLAGLSSWCIQCKKATAKRPSKMKYDLWRGMIARCYDESHESYENYGAKGIRVCDRWRNSIDAFWDDMGDRPDGTSLDRMDSSGDYEPGNCRWASIVEQNNNKSNIRHITWNGRTQNMTAWARELGISAATLHQRLTRMNLSIDDAFTIPVTRLDRKGRFGSVK